MSIYLGVDVGTSFVKAAVLDVDRREIGYSERAPFPGFVEGLPELWREVDPEAVFRTVETLLDRVRARAPRCDGLVLCGQMHGFVLVDAHGKAVSNYISWLDQRVTPSEFERLSGRIEPSERREIGSEFRASIAAPLLWWMSENGSLPTGAVTPVSIADYVAARLCGASPILDPTQAAAFGALRLSALDWHEGVIEKLGLESLRWPAVRGGGAVVGLWQGAPCRATIGDQQCALAGALLAEGELSVNIGTGSQVAVITGADFATDLQVRPYFDGHFLRTITHIPAGRALSDLIRLMTELGGLTEQDAWPRIEAAVERVQSTDLRASAAFFPGPCGFGGYLENLHEANLTIGHVFRAVFESMARNYADCARRLDPPAAFTGVVFSGGIARRVTALRELVQTALGLPHRLSPHEEDTLYGLMVLARAFAGLDKAVISDQLPRIGLDQ